MDMRTFMLKNKKGEDCLTVLLNDADWKTMNEKDKNGDTIPQVLTPSTPVTLAEVVIQRLTPDMEKKLEQMQSKAKDDFERMIRYKRLSPCCGAKMAHEEGDAPDVYTCIQCQKKHKKSEASPLPASPKAS